MTLSIDGKAVADVREAFAKVSRSCGGLVMAMPRTNRRLSFVREAMAYDQEMAKLRLHGLYHRLRIVKIDAQWMARAWRASFVRCLSWVVDGEIDLGCPAPSFPGLWLKAWRSYKRQGILRRFLK